MNLQDKTAFIFAASGAIASGVARTFAAQGARVILSARREDPVKQLAEEITAQGQHAAWAVVDATDQAQVREHLREYGASGVDIIFNGIGARPASLGYPARSLETSVEDFMKPIELIVASQFLTAREGARLMIDQGRAGSIITLSATLSGGGFAHMAGISAACGAVEVMTNVLAAEFGPAGVRVNCVRGSAMPETRTIQETGAGQAALQPEKGMDMAMPPLGRPVTVGDTARAALFLASDFSQGVTSQMLTVCAGQFPSHA